MSEFYLAERRPYEGGKPGDGRLDKEGVEWFACDPYPTWYRWVGTNLYLLGDNFPGWADEENP